jgi:outer membrane receptor protein involved in Fe transport
MGFSCRVSIWALALAVLAVPLVFAQSQATTGVIQGFAQDESGAALPGVTITMTNTDTGFIRSVVSEASGRFYSALMPLGPYTVTASLEGFATLVREGLVLRLGGNLNVTFEMQLSAIGEEITVTGAENLIETTRVENQVLFNSDVIEGLPVKNRNFLDFNLLTPGATLVQNPDGNSLTINGQKGINNNVMVDGADFNNPFFGEQRGGQRPAYTFNIDSINEVLVVTEGAPAEFGRSAGGFVNVVTKSGTNNIAATVHYFYKSDGLSDTAKNRDGSEDPRDFTQNQFGFTIGGAIKRDSLFYFVAADTQSREETKQFDPFRIDPEIVAFMAEQGLSDENAPITREDDADAYLAKIDWQVNEKNLLTARWAYHYSNQPNGTFDVNSWGSSSNAIEKDWAHGFTLNLLSTINSRTLNEFRGQYAKEWRPRPYNGPNVPGQNRPFPDTGFNFVNSYRGGMPFFIPVEYDDDRLQLVNNVSYLMGDHSLKAGFEFNDVTSSQTFVGFANGRYIFNSFDGFRNHVANPDYIECSDGSSNTSGSCPSGTTPTGPVLLYLQFAGVGGLTPEQAGTQNIQQKEYSLFVQDQWQPSPNLTLEFGLRWEGLDMPDPITPPSEVFYAPFIGQTVTNETGTHRFPSDGTIPDDMDQWQPRLAVAWTPKGQSNRVLRASTGIYHSRIPALSIASSRSTNGSVGQTAFRNSELGGLGILPPPPQWPDRIDPEALSNADFVFFPQVFVFDENFETPRTWNSAISWEQEFIPNYAFLFKANYAETENITRFINRNDPVFGCPWSTGLAPGGGNGIACDPTGGLTTVESSARSEYWGLTFGVNKRLSNNFQFEFYYTYSEDKSDDDNERDPFSYRYARADTLGPEFGLSDRHQQNRLNFWLLWNAPYGINTSFRWSYRDPQPLSLTENGLPAATPQDRINADGSITERNLGEKDNEFNTFDIRISKDFNVGNWTIQPILDVFNVFNNVNFITPQTTSLLFNFDGTIRSGAGQPREMQLGIRFLR